MHRLVHHNDGGTKHYHLGGWKRQPRDSRDYRLTLPKGYVTLPAAVDLSLNCSAVEDQGDLGSCTANMFAAMVEANEVRVGRKLAAAAPKPKVSVTGIVQNADGSVSFNTKVTPVVVGPTPTPTPTPTPPNPVPPAPAKLVQVSRLFEYYATRKIEGTVTEDSGATIRDAIKAGYTYGVVDEALWPYETTKFAVNPSSSLWTAAATHKVSSYQSIADGDLTTMKSALASGYLVGFGFDVYDYFLSQEMAVKAVLHLPKAGEQLQGGHAVCLAGYSDAKSAFLVRNSWSADWGLNGYFWMDYDYVAETRLCSDFWVIQSSPI